MVDLAAARVPFPGAAICNFDGDALRRAEYGAIKHVKVIRALLKSRQRYLRHL